MSAQRACALSEVPVAGALHVDLDGPTGSVPVAVVRDEDGDLHAISDVCSHQAIALSEGEVVSGEIGCWVHGSVFDVRTGRTSSLPAVSPVPVYRVSVVGDDVLVEVSTDVGPLKEQYVMTE